MGMGRWGGVWERRRGRGGREVHHVGRWVMALLCVFSCLSSSGGGGKWFV